jgi:hypothetical protein
MMGVAKGWTGTFSAGLLVLSGFLIIGGVAAVMLKRMTYENVAQEARRATS